MAASFILHSSECEKFPKEIEAIRAKFQRRNQAGPDRQQEVRSIVVTLWSSRVVNSWKMYRTEVECGSPKSVAFGMFESEIRSMGRYLLWLHSPVVNESMVPCDWKWLLANGHCFLQERARKSDEAGQFCHLASLMLLHVSEEGV